MMVLAAAQEVVQKTSYVSLWVYLIIGLITLIGTGVTVAKWFKQQGIAAATLEARLAAIEKAMKPNGRDTQQVGDIVARTEDLTRKVATQLDALDTKLDQHIGSEAEAREQMRRDIRRLKEAS